MVLLKKCCLFFQLKSGCFILGYFQLIETIVKLLCSIGTIVAAFIITKRKDRNETIKVYILVGICVAFAVLLVLAFAFGIVLLLGLHKNKPGYLKIYLKYNLIYLIITAVLLGIEIIIGWYGSNMQIVFLVFDIYILIVVRSYYTKLIEKKAQYLRCFTNL